MADTKQLKYLLVQVLILLSIVAITGHLSGNFWERYVRRHEISRIKNSLHDLKETIGKIGNTYDILHDEVTGLIINSTSYLPHKKANNSAPKKIQVFVMDNSGGQGDRLYSNTRKTSNATTSTKNPLKATGVGLDSLVECPTKTECKHASTSETTFHECLKAYIACTNRNYL